jgi:hypothetical protein
VVTIGELVVADAPRAWEELGFRVDADVCRIGTVPLRLAGTDAGHGIVEWSLQGAAQAVEGLPTRVVDEPPEAASDRVEHPNGALQLDHVVVATGEMARTIASVEAAGIPLRRLREDRPRRMAFFRLGEVILELVEGEEGTPPSFWGLVVVVKDLDGVAADLGDRLGEPHDAVQPGRRIASLREGSGVTPPLAFMSAP